MMRLQILFCLALLLAWPGAALGYELDSNNDGYIDTSLLDVGTDPGDIVQLGAACTVGDGAYTDQTTCEDNSGEWVGVLPIICDADTEDCDTPMDIPSGKTVKDWIAAGVGNADLTAPGPIGSVTPSTGAFTDLTAQTFDFGDPETGETGEIGLQEDPINGTNVFTLKAPSSMSADRTIELDGLTEVVTAPTTATDPCTAGMWAVDAAYIYICQATDTWLRAAIATW